MSPEEFHTYMMGGLSEKEWRELVTLEYVLTWNYSDDIDSDERRYKQLSERCWEGRINDKILKL